MFFEFDTVYNFEFTLKIVFSLGRGAWGHAPKNAFIPLSFEGVTRKDCYDRIVVNGTA